MPAQSQRIESNDDHSRYARLNTAVENFVDYLADTLKPQLETQGFTQCAQTLQQHLDRFDEHCDIPYQAHTMSAGELRKSYDKSASALARICGMLYRHVDQHCSFAEQHDMLDGMMQAMHDFNRNAPHTLKTLGLEYHEFDSLTLELEAKMGVGQPLKESSDGFAEKTQRRRRMPKDPEKILAALLGCVETAQSLRPRITNEERQATLDKIVADVKSILSNLPPLPEKAPEGSNETLDADALTKRQYQEDKMRGRHISALMSASAKIFKVSKWVRKVDLLEGESSQSTKQEILRQFDELKALSQGQSLSK